MLSSKVASSKLSLARRGVAVRAPLARKAMVVRATAESFPKEWIKKDALVLGASFLGWTIPSSIPTSAFDGQSLFGLLNASIGEQLAHFPTGPALSDKFWLYLITWHIGLFLTMVLGQVGVQGRKQGYFQ